MATSFLDFDIQGHDECLNEWDWDTPKVKWFKSLDQPVRSTLDCYYTC